MVGSLTVRGLLPTRSLQDVNLAFGWYVPAAEHPASFAITRSPAPFRVMDLGWPLSPTPVRWGTVRCGLCGQMARMRANSLRGTQTTDLAAPNGLRMGGNYL